MNQISGRKHNEVASYAKQYSEDFVERWDELIDWEKRKAGRTGSSRTCCAATVRKR